MSDVVDVLMAGRDLVIERGHCKFRLESKDGHVCAIGAVRLAGGGVLAEVALGKAAYDLYPERTIPYVVSQFNDHPDTTPGEVIDVFDYAIACEKEKLALGNEGQR